MKVDQNNYKFYRSFRIRTEEKDKVFIIIKKIYLGDVENYTNSTSVVLDFNSQGLSFNSDVKIPLDSEIEFHFKCEKFRSKFSKILRGQVIRSFVSDKYSKEFNYAVKLEKEDEELNEFISKFIEKFSKERLARYFKESCFNTRSADLSEAKEVYSLVISIFKNFLKNEEDKKKKNEVDFTKIQEQLNLENLSLVLLDEKDTFATHQTGKDHNRVYEKFDFSKVRLSCFATNKVVAHHEENDKGGVYYIAAPIINKFNKPIGVLEFIKTEEFGQFSFEDEKVIQLMAYILSAQLKNHRPVIPNSQFEHMNPKKIPLGYLEGISTARNNIMEIVKTLMLQRSSTIIVGDEGDRKFLTEYVGQKYSILHDIVHSDINDLSNINWENGKCYIFNLSNVDTMQINAMAYAIDKHPECKVILHTSYNNWLSHQNEYYKLNLLSTMIPPVINRSEDFLDIAELICEMSNIGLDSKIKESITTAANLEYLQSFETFKNFIIGEEISKEEFNKKEMAEALFKVHDQNLTLEEYNDILDSSDRFFNKFKMPATSSKTKKAA